MRIIVETPILSILVITHNQRSLLERCLGSVINQYLSIPFEIIVSDDRSKDGTREFIEGFRQMHVGAKENLIELMYILCNSDECHPTNTSERCGWNKLNAYLRARGKYFINLDADDYLRSDDILQLQVDTLESHPDCSMCMQRALSLKEGDSIEKGYAWPQNQLLQDGRVIDVDSFIKQGLRGLNQTYMIRRRPEDDMKSLYGKWFDDTVITYHHIQYGPVVFIDRSDYVWVQYKESISHKMSHDDAAIVYGLLPLFHADLIPSLSSQFILSGIPTLNHLLKTAPEFPELSQQYRAYLNQFKGFVYRYYLSTEHDFYDRVRIKASRLLLRLANRFKWEAPCVCKMIVRALI